MLSSDPKPSPKEQLQEIENLVKQEKKAYSKWYLIPFTWYKDFLEYCTDPDTNIEPGPIDTSVLLVNDKVTIDKSKVELLPEEAYNLLVKWYKRKNCKDYFRYATYTTEEHIEVGIDLNVKLYNVIVKKDHKMGRVNREVQIRFGSEENEIKNQLQGELNLPDTDFKLLYRQNRIEEFHPINDFIANDDHNEIKEILALYEGTKEEEEQFLKEFKLKGRKEDEYYDLRISDGFWVQAKISKFGDSTLNYDLIVVNKSLNRVIWASEYDDVIRPLYYYTPNFREFKSGDVVIKKVISEYKPLSVINVDLERKKIRLYSVNGMKEEDIESDVLYDNEAFQILRDNKNNVLGSKSSSSSSSTTTTRPVTSTNIDLSFNHSNTAYTKIKTNDSSSSSSSSSGSYSTYNYYSHYNSEPPAPGVVGLSNIGNTCFMDSMLQCMSNCQPLTEYFLSGDYADDINETNPIGTKGELARSYANLLDNLWNGHSAVFTPSVFKHTIGKHAPRFAGFEQQDSSELMNYLLDGLHEDLNKIKNKPYIEGVNTDGKTLEEAANEYWQVHLARNTSKIVDIFCGQLRSHLVCPKCENASDIFDPYYSLSLPIPDRITYKSDALYYNDFNKPPLRLTITSNNDEVDDFEVALRSQLNIPPTDKLLNIDYTDGSVSGRTASYYYRYRGRNMYCYFNVTEITRKFNDYCHTLGSDMDDITEADNNNNNNNNFSSDSDSSTNNNNNNSNASNSYSYNHNNNNDDDNDVLSKYTFVNFKLEGSGYGNSKYYYPQMYPLDMKNHQNEKLLKHLINEYVEEKYIVDYKNDSFYKNKCDVILNEGIPLDVKNKLNEAIDDESYNKIDEKKDISLNDCIDLLLREEVLSEEDMWHCPKCKEFVRASKKFFIWSIPEILIIHLKRFSVKMDKKFAKYGFGSREKLDTVVYYPEHIDLSSYVNGPHNTNCKYSLYAVSEHSGSLSFGHYTAKCKNFKDGNWYDFNDSSVHKCNGPKPSSYDYVLFYQRDKS